MNLVAKDKSRKKCREKVQPFLVADWLHKNPKENKTVNTYKIITSL